MKHRSPTLPLTVIYADGRTTRLLSEDQIALFEGFELRFDSTKEEDLFRTGISQILDVNAEPVHIIVDRLKIDHLALSDR